MKKIVLLVALSFVASFANAQEGYETAARICTNMTFDSDKIKCMSEIRGNLFDENVLDICAKQTFDSDKRACLTVIANKRYTSETEINMCRTQTFDSDKRKCLASASSEPMYANGPITTREIDQRLARALSAMRNGNYGKAESILERLREDLRDAR